MTKNKPAALLTDPEKIKELKAKIDSEERTLFAEFEVKMKAKREKEFAVILDPLRAEEKKMHEQIETATVRLREIEHEISSLTGETKKVVKATKGKRIRRSSDELKNDAEQVLAWLKKNPGAKSSAISAGSGIEIKSPLNAKSLIEKYIDGVKIEASGKKAGTTYSVA